MRDHFAHSVFVGRELRAAINQELDCIFQDLRGRLTEVRAKGALYITGSLARQEPSIDLRSGEARLRSDVDLVFATYEDELARPCIAALEQWGRERWPTYDLSVVFVPLNGLRELRSCFARDLAIAAESPLYGDAPPREALPNGPATQADYLESAIHQTAALLLLESVEGRGEWLYSRDSAYHHIRAALELLRCIAATDGSVVRLCELPEHSNAAGLRGLVTRDDIVAAIRARELFDGSATTLDVLELLRAASSICYVDRTPDRTFSEVVAALDAAPETDQLIPAFQRAFLAYAMGVGGGALDTTIPVVRRILGRLPEASSPKLSSYLRGAADELQSWTAEHCTLKLRLLREDYIAALHRHNLGWELPKRDRTSS